MPAPSAKGLFRATKPKPREHPAQVIMGLDLPEQKRPQEARDPLDFDPTPPEATAAFLVVERDYICRHGKVIWENAVGAGHMARVFERCGFKVIGSDITDRGWPGTQIKSFYDFDKAPACINITNPPYCEVNSRAHGRWMWHSLKLDIPYIALLLSSEWCAARQNGMDLLFHDHPPSVEYQCCWKIDFRGGGQAPQRNSFFVWDKNRPPLGPNQWRCVRLFHDIDARQEALL